MTENTPFCLANNGVGSRILQGMKSLFPDLTAKSFLWLDFECDDMMIQPLMWTLTESLMYLWKARTEKTKTTLDEVKSSVEADLGILKETKFSDITDAIKDLIELLLPDQP